MIPTSKHLMKKARLLRNKRFQLQKAQKQGSSVVVSNARYFVKTRTQVLAKNGNVVALVKWIPFNANDSFVLPKGINVKQYFADYYEGWEERVTPPILIPRNPVTGESISPRGWIKQKLENSKVEVLQIVRESLDGLDKKLSVHIKDRPMYGAKYVLSLLGDTSAVMKEDSRCVADVLWYVVREIQDKHRRLMKVTKEQISKELGEKPTAQNLTDLIKKIGNISTYGFNGFGELVISYTPDQKTGGRTFGNLIYVIMNDHLYPVFDEAMKQHAVKAQRLDLQYTIRCLEFTEHIAITKKQFDPHKNYKSPAVLITDLEDLDELYLETHIELGQDIPQMSMDGDHITEFVHPIHNTIFSSAFDYEDRKKVCDYIYNNVFKDATFMFQNQSWRTIAQKFFEFRYGFHKKSHLNTTVQNWFDQYPAAPLIGSNIQAPDGCDSIDIVKGYSGVVQSMPEHYCIMSIFDELVENTGQLKEIKPGFYEIKYTLVIQPQGGGFIAKKFGQNERVLCPLNGIVVPNGKCSHIRVNFLLENKFITFDDISRYVTSSYCLEATTFKDFVKDIYDMFPNDGKMLFNTFQGGLGQRMKKRSKALATNSREMAMSMLFDEVNKGNQVSYKEFKDLMLLKSTQVDFLSSNHYPIYHQIVDGGIVKLLTLYKKMTNSDTIICNWRVDCITAMYANDVEITDNKLDLGKYHLEPVTKRSVNAKSYSYEEYIPQPAPEWNHLEYIYKTNSYKKLPDRYIMNGEHGGGECKTRTACDQWHAFHKEERILFLAFRNCVIQNFLGWCEDAEAYTFDKFFLKYKDFEGYHRIIVDEFDNTPAEWVTRLCEQGELYPELKFNIYSCKIQCLPVESAGRQFDYYQSTAVKALAGCNYIRARYCEGIGKGRFDEDLRREMSHFIANRRLTNTFKDIDDSLDVNITVTNKKRLSINYKKIKDRTEGLKLGDITYQVGDRIICNFTGIDDRAKTYNNEFYTIKEIDAEYIYLKKKNAKKEVMLKHNRFRMSKGDDKENPRFELCYAFTIDKIQSITIDEPFNIHQLDHSHMYYQRVITAIGRATKKKYIHCKPVVEEGGSTPPLQTREYHAQPYATPDEMTPLGLYAGEADARYKNGKIYGIYYDNEPVYIGHTIQSIEDRFEQHLKDVRKQNEKFKEWYAEHQHHRHKLSILTLENYPCNSKWALEQREKWWIYEHASDFSLLNVDYVKVKKPKIPKFEINVALLDHEEIKFRNDEKNHKLHIKLKDGTWKMKNYKKIGLESAKEYLMNIYHS